MTDLIPAHRSGLLIALLLLATAPAFAQTAPLNDTGQITCYNDSAATGTVSPATPDPEQPGFTGQDCTQGRSAADALGTLVKIGASTTPGRDYTKIANDGSVLPASATLGSGPGDWACTRDNVTGLIWEVKVDDDAHLRHYNHIYEWYDTNTAINGGDPGSTGDNTCNSTLPDNLCNTSAFRDAVNALGLCGATDWRLPTANELQSLVDYDTGTAPCIDVVWFPNSSMSGLWSGETYVSGFFDGAWYVSFNSGYLYASSKYSSFHHVRLVRGGQ